MMNFAPSHNAGEANAHREESNRDPIQHGNVAEIGISRPFDSQHIKLYSETPRIEGEKRSDADDAQGDVPTHSPSDSFLQRCRCFSVPLSIVFAIQSLVIAGAFIAVIAVLTIQHAHEYDDAIHEAVRLRQDTARLMLLHPFLLRQAGLDQLTYRMKRLGTNAPPTTRSSSRVLPTSADIINDGGGMITRIDSTLTSLRNFWEAAHVSTRVDPFIDTVYTDEHHR